MSCEKIPAGDAAKKRKGFIKISFLASRTIRNIFLIFVSQGFWRGRMRCHAKRQILLSVDSDRTGPRSCLRGNPKMADAVSEYLSIFETREKLFYKKPIIKESYSPLP
jgi:hypothetical protein